MAKKEPMDFRQDRRQWLKTSATVLGSALLPLPPVSERTATPSPDTRPADAESASPFFTPAEHTLVEELAETIIPVDSHSGGAKAAKVADYIEQVLRETTDEKGQRFWLIGA